MDGAPIKVTCRTCHNEVKFRPPRDEQAHRKKQLDRLMKMREKKQAAAKAPSPAPTGATAGLRAIWDQLTEKVDARSCRVYDPTKTYAPEEALLHKKHGMGIVHDVHGDGLMRVLFRKGFQDLPSRQEPDLDE